MVGSDSYFGPPSTNQMGLLQLVEVVVHSDNPEVVLVVLVVVVEWSSNLDQLEETWTIQHLHSQGNAGGTWIPERPEITMVLVVVVVPVVLEQSTTPAVGAGGAGLASCLIAGPATYNWCGGAINPGPQGQW